MLSVMHGTHWKKEGTTRGRPRRRETAIIIMNGQDGKGLDCNRKKEENFQRMMDIGINSLLGLAQWLSG